MSEELRVVSQSTEVSKVARVILTDSEVLQIIEQWPSFSVTHDLDEDGSKTMTLHLEGRKISGARSIRELVERFANFSPDQLVQEFGKKRYVGLPTTQGVKQTIIKKGRHGHPRNRLGA